MKLTYEGVTWPRERKKGKLKIIHILIPLKFT